MSQTVKNLLINIDYNNAKLKELSGDIKKIQGTMQGMSRSSREFQQASQGMEKLQKSANNLNKTLGQTEKSVEDNTKAVGRWQSAMGAFWKSTRTGAIGFNGTLLTLLFFGIQLQRLFGNAMRSIVEGYRAAIPEAHAFNIAVTRMSANWEFFKFQLADALANSTLFTRFVEFTINIIRRLQEMSDGAKTFLVAFIAIGLAFSTIIFYLGSMSMGILGITDLVLGAKAAMLKLANSSGKSMGAIAFGGAKAIAIFVAIAAIIAVATVSYRKFADSSDYARDKVQNLKDGIVMMFNDLLRGFGFSSIELRNFNELMVRMGAVVQSVIAIFLLGFYNIFKAVQSVAYLIGTILFGALAIAADGIAALVRGLRAVAIWLGASSSELNEFDDTIRKLDNFSRYSKDFVVDMNVEFFEGWGDVNKKLTSAITNPAEAVRQYRKELEELENAAPDEIDVNVNIDDFNRNIESASDVLNNIPIGFTQSPSGNDFTQSPSGNNIVIVNSPEEVVDMGLSDVFDYLREQGLGDLIPGQYR